MLPDLSHIDARNHTMPKIFETPAELKGAIGEELGKSNWLEITQERVDQFAEATGDHQWIHVDPGSREGRPFRWNHRPRLPHPVPRQSLPSPDRRGAGDLHGGQLRCDKLRFPAPVPVGSRVRGSATLLSAEDAKGGAVQATIRVSVEIEGSDRPGCVIDTISRYFPEE